MPTMARYPHIEEEMREYFAALATPAQSLYRLHRARVLGEGNAHGIITNQDRFVLGQHANWGQEIENHPIHYTLRFPRCLRVPGTSFSMISDWSDNYWHWLFDVIGKWLVLREREPACLPKIDHYLVLNLSQFPFKLQSLLQLGVAKSQVIDVNHSAHLCCDDLLIADRPHLNPILEQDLIDALRRAFLPQARARAGTRRIYISRARCKNRRLANEAELVARLQPLGFETVYLEDWDFSRQVQLFQDVGVVLAQHGAGLSNLVFCAPGVKMFELMEPEHINPCYALICEKLSLEYTMLCNGKAEHIARSGWRSMPDQTSFDVDEIIDVLFRSLGQS